MGIRASAEGWARARPARAISLIAAGALVVGGVVGLGAGYKIEQHRLASGVKRLQTQVANRTQLRTPATTNPTVRTSGSGTERVGTVTAVAADSIAVATKHLGVLRLRITSATQFERAVVGSKADLAVRRRVLIPIGGREVLVLPSASPLGRTVTKVTSATFSVTKVDGTGSAVIRFANAKVIDTVTAATRSDVKKASKVIAAVQTATKGNVVAVEVILLPAGSAFAN